MRFRGTLLNGTIRWFAINVFSQLIKNKNVSPSVKGGGPIRNSKLFPHGETVANVVYKNIIILLPLVISRFSDLMSGIYVKISSDYSIIGIL